MEVFDRKALVLFSGGQDSTTCLAWALKRFARVRSVAIDYGQRHRIELQAAVEVARRAGVEHALLPCDSFRALGGNALTGTEAVQAGVRAEDSLPNTFVPGRNLIFLGLAAAFAYQRRTANIVTGVCETDYSGYPDCREATMQAMQEALRRGMDAPFVVHTPLMRLSKADTVRLARDLGALPLLAWSHTCYNGSVPPCGTCPACVLRAKGFAEAGVPDPLVERVGARSA
jgi:7-cyano-7-deazaguanine synthase